MQGKLGLEARQKQTLSLHAGVLQSLEILRMPLAELTELLASRICDNPLLELEAAPGSEAPNLDEKQVPVPLADEENAGYGDSYAVDTAEVLLRGRLAPTVSLPEDYDPLATCTTEQTFCEMLHEQLGALALEDNFALLCRYIIDSLDRQGYLDTSPEEIAGLLQCDVFDVYQALYLVQSLQPAGVAARTLEECLLLQLVQGQHFNAACIRLVKDGLPLIAAGDIGGIERLLDADRETALEACRVIKSLNPIPSQGYYTGEEKAHVIPDARVVHEGAGFAIYMNRDSIPHLEINREYATLLEKTKDTDASHYLREKLGEAKTLLRAVAERESTLLRIMRQVVGLQPGYFRDGSTLLPMAMTHVADALELNTSTISRAVQGKYIECAAGVVELKSLFSQGVANQQGEVISARVIQQKIKECIAAEDPAHPLSDESIRVALQAMQIDVARRTVAKYREELGILSSSKRARRL